jgi:hypothetical protein
MLTQVKINSVDVSSYVLNYEIDNSLTDSITQAEMKLYRKVFDIVTINNGQTIEIWRGWSTSTDEKIFSGYIESYDLGSSVQLVYDSINNTWFALCSTGAWNII